MGVINSDEFATVSSANGGEPLKPYDVEINGIKTTVRLTDGDARRRGLLSAEEQPTPEEVSALKAEVADLKAQLAEKEREMEDKAKADKAAAADAAKAKTGAANKAATPPANKGAAPEAPKA